ncbi:hypothetical protein GCM10008018_67490 [Paenibacillus marchantiophytorum]|uniref:Uncharacterized protein n=1 Tax=Paenibacillus marchantiophytorum TaxID=1619310 RepID=A0ABQ1FH07_9BACL|nr:hypothetical protein GCM10008018_67490 [Paenibacillus marchantiophytorum]
MPLTGLKQSGFMSFEITELEGTAYLEDLERMSQLSDVDLIDFESYGQIPTGVHWLNVRYGRK